MTQSDGADQLRQSHLLLAGILAIATDAIIWTGEDQRIRVFNTGAQRIFGFSEAEAVGAPLDILLPERFKTGHADHFRTFGLSKIASREMGDRREILGRRKSGEEFPAEAAISKLTVGTDGIYVVVLRDITERRMQEAVLERRVAERTGELSALLDAVPDAILTKDANRRILSANATLTEMFGYSRTEVLGMQAAVLYATSDDERKAIDAWSHWEQDGAKRPVMVKCKRRDATVFPAMVLGSAVRDAQGHILSRVSLIRDMTDELRRQSFAIQSQRMEALGQLTGGIAHDSNNLLTVITGNLEMVEEELTGHPALKYVHEAQEAANMGARLNQRLLTFARRRRLEPHVVNLNDQVLAMSELLARTLGETIKLTTSLAHDLGATLVDPSEVENAVLNLAINARDAMPQGGNLRIETANATFDDEEARIEKGLAPGPYVRVSVSDTGTGMPPEIVARAFEPFFTTKGPGKGTGLGLATVFGFVKQSQGHVSVYSEAGRGTAIHLYLPRLETPAGEGAVGAPSSGMPKARGETILVVEDNAQVRALTVARLARLGYKILEAADGPTALRELQDQPAVDLVFSDVVMPGGLSGFDLVREILARNPQQRVLLTSGFAEDMVRGNESLLERQPILRKPYSLQKLAASIREALDLEQYPVTRDRHSDRVIG